MSAEEKIEALTAILNDRDSYEYEGLGWNEVAMIRRIFGIPEPTGAWLA